MSGINQVFDPNKRVAPIGIIYLKGAEKLAKKIEEYLIRWKKEMGVDRDNLIIESVCPRFQSGDAKGMIKSTVRGYDLYIIADVGNSSVTYSYFGKENRMSPDDHFQDLKRIIQAVSGKAHRINVIMPLLYGGRQDKRSYRESLDCACALQELERMGVNNIVTFDAHDSRVENAIPLLGFDNLMPTYQVLKALYRYLPDITLDKDNFMMVSPDEGAINRNMYYASVLGVEMGMFYKRRDYSKIIDGMHPIIEHEYLGADVQGKTVFCCDDIISSGGSMLDVAYRVKEFGAKEFYCFATYPQFTKGTAIFDKAYEEGFINGVFGSNLSYLDPELQNKEWFYEVDVAKYVSYFISALNHDTSVSALIDPHMKIQSLIARKMGVPVR